MAFNVIDMDWNGSYLLNDGDFTTLFEGRTLASATNGFVATLQYDGGLSDVNLNVLGTVVAQENGIHLTDFGEIVDGYEYEFTENVDIVVGPAGGIYAGEHGMYIETLLDSTISVLGTVIGEEGGITLFGEPDETAIDNSGTIGSLDGHAIGSEGDLIIDNEGSIYSSAEPGIAAIRTDGALDLANSGSITSAAGEAIQADGGANHEIDNSGLIDGDVALGGGNDAVSNTGTIDGDVLFGDGNDTYDAFGGDGIVTGKVRGGDGEDTMMGGEAADDFAGGDGDDGLRGRDGDDTLDGGDGEDDLRGGDGDDMLDGGRNDDVLRGGEGDDEIYGDKGADGIRGGEGDDLIAGERHGDMMSGGEGDDVFLYLEVEDSLNADRDVITDFEVGSDTIDLSALALGADFVDSLSGMGGAEIRLADYGSGAGTRVHIDVDGDGAADMQINLEGAFGVSELDFVL